VSKCKHTRDAFVCIYCAGVDDLRAEVGALRERAEKAEAKRVCPSCEREPSSDWCRSCQDGDWETKHPAIVDLRAEVERLKLENHRLLDGLHMTFCIAVHDNARCPHCRRPNTGFPPYFEHVQGCIYGHLQEMVRTAHPSDNRKDT
jgi:hypothetical protein